MKLFGHPDSGHSLKARFYMRFAGLAHQYERVDIFAHTRSQEFLHAFKFAEVPTLIDGEMQLIQSNAILLYLAD